MKNKKKTTYIYIIGLLCGVLLMSANSIYAASENALWKLGQFVNDMPEINITRHSDELSGLLYFEASNPFQDGRLGQVSSTAYTYDLATEDLQGRKFSSFGMMHQPLNNGYSSTYRFTIYEWLGIRQNRGDGIPFADGGAIYVHDENGNKHTIVTHDNGLDLHDFEILENGNYLFLRTVIQDTLPNWTRECIPRCAVLSQAIHEGTPGGETITDINILDAYSQDDLILDDMMIKGNVMLYDVTHANSVQRTSQGYLVSVRHTSEVIHFAQDGAIIWRTSDYAIDSPFSHQHDAQLLDNGNLLLFDNGNGIADYSRAIEYTIDHNQKTLTRVWEYTTGHYAPNRGSVQRLASGDTLINFVDGGIVLIDENNNPLLEITMPEKFASYQARIVQ